jgi:hypothetical protein
MNSYYNWGELLALAPIAVSRLEKLIVMSYQPRMDFRLNTENLSSGSYEFIKYQNNFQTTLLQIGHQGYLAFLNAHVNIDKIRMYNSKVSSHIKDAVRYLMSKNELYIVELLPISLGRIKEAADGNKMLLHQVDSELRTVIELIQATITCVTITKHVNENELERVELDLKSLSGRRKTRQDVERTSALNVAKGNCLEVIRALQEGRQELENLKRDWSKLKDFYSRMEYFVAKATENSIAFIEVVRVIAKDLNVLDDEEIFVNLLEKIQKANEASFLVRGVSDMYVNVSVKYIMDQIASQGDIMARIDNSQVEIEEIRNDLMSAHRIRDYIKADEISLRTRFVDRHNQIMDEYQWMLESWIVPAPRIESSAEEKSKFLSVSSNTKKKNNFVVN